MSRYGTYDLKYGFIPDDDCPETPKPTNADRIRNMTDEELAKFIERTMFMVYESVAKVCRMVGYAGQWDSEGIIREELEWLKQEADERK